MNEKGFATLPLVIIVLAVVAVVGGYLVFVPKAPVSVDSEAWVRFSIPSIGAELYHPQGWAVQGPVREKTQYVESVAPQGYTKVGLREYPGIEIGFTSTDYTEGEHGAKVSVVYKVIEGTGGTWGDRSGVKNKFVPVNAPYDSSLVRSGMERWEGKDVFIVSADKLDPSDLQNIGNGMMYREAVITPLFGETRAIGLMLETPSAEKEKYGEVLREMFARLVPPATLRTGWVTYADSRYGFQFDRPPETEMIPVPSNATSPVYGIFPFTGRYWDSPLNFQTLAVHQKGLSEPIVEWYRRVIFPTRTPLAIGQEGPVQRTVNGRSALEDVYDAGMETPVRTVFIDYGDFVISLPFGGAGFSLAEKLSPAREKFINSFR